MSTKNNNNKSVITDETIINCYVNNYNEGNEEEKRQIINGVLNYGNPRVYRYMLTYCTLSTEDQTIINAALLSTKETEEGFAENFYYLLQTDSRRLNFPNGMADIRDFVDRAFKANGIEVPKDIDELINNHIEEHEPGLLGTTMAWIKQHVMVDNNPSTKKIPYNTSFSKK